MFSIFQNEVIHLTHHYKWLVFVESYDSFKSDWEKLLAPYNCEFIICFPTKRDTYKLMEVYKLKNRMFSNEFGIFENNQISLPDTYLFWRRMNLNGTKLEINSPPQVIIKFSNQKFFYISKT